MTRGDAWWSALDPEALTHPGVFALLAGAVIVAAIIALVRGHSALVHPAWPELVASGVLRRDAIRPLLLGLRVLALLALAWVVADPVVLGPSRPRIGQGLDIMLVVDTSGSMRALDTRDGGSATNPPALSADASASALGPRTRLDLALDAVRRFASVRVSEGDRVGLVVFGEHAFTQTPLTGDGAALDFALDDVRAEMAGRRTAIGDALALAVKRLDASARPARSGRVVVLLTDGRNTAGEIPPMIAIDLARAKGVRVHTVGIGSLHEQVAVATERTGHVKLEYHAPDFEILGRIAIETGGRFHRALHPDDLLAVYREIDALERVERPLPQAPRQRPRPEPALAFAFALVLAEIGLGRIAGDRFP